MAVMPNNPKPFTCQDCQKGFVSVDKLNHHQHRMHGVPRQLSLNVNAAARFNHPAVPIFEPISDEAVLENRTRNTLTDETPTPTRISNMLSDVSEMISTDYSKVASPMQMVNQYDLTPSVFDNDFRRSLGAVAGKNSQSPGTSARPRRSSPRSPRTPGTIRAIESSPSKADHPQVTNSLPVSPKAYFMSHINSAGQFVTSPILPVPVSPTVVFPVPANPTMSFVGAPPLLLPYFDPTSTYNQNGVFLSNVQGSASSSVDHLATLQKLWAAAGADRESATPKSQHSEEGSSKRKRKFDDLASETSESFSLESSETSATHPRHTRPILDTDDPVLADKRRRNRIAAEKCRTKRKEKQSSLEKDNEELKEKIRLLESRYQQLSQVSQQTVGQLKAENDQLKAELGALKKHGVSQIPVPTTSAAASNPFILKSER